MIPIPLVPASAAGKVFTVCMMHANQNAYEKSPSPVKTTVFGAEKTPKPIQPDYTKE